MLTQPQLQRFARESGIRNLEIVEKEVVLTYFLQLLSERGFLADMAFKTIECGCEPNSLDSACRCLRCWTPRQGVAAYRSRPCALDLRLTATI